jgi:hypothetical protein
LVDGPGAGGRSVPAGEFAIPPRALRVRPLSSQSVVAVAHLRVGQGGGGTSVPVLSGPQINEKWIRNQPPSLNDHQRALLERHGYHVDQHRRIVTVPLSDGRRVAVPIDQVQFRYTGNNPL